MFGICYIFDVKIDNILSKKEFPKVLLTAPQHESKNYCWAEWLGRATNLTYPNYEIFLADNSPTRDNYNMIKEAGIACEHIRQNQKGLAFTINDAHNACRKYALNNRFEYIFHLETDVIPPFDVIERLMNYNLKVVAGCYDIRHGKDRQIMAQLDDEYDRSVRAFRTVEMADELEPLLFDGTLQKVYHAGLGCILIKSDVLKLFPFRVQKGTTLHSDTWFANDCFERKIPIYLDTSIQCEHLNSTWLAVAGELGTDG